MIKGVIKSLKDNGVIEAEEYKDLVKLLNKTGDPTDKPPKLELMTRKEVADFYKVCKQNVDKLADAGKLTRLRITERGVRFNKQEVEELLTA